MLNNSIEKAQRRVEQQNFMMRKRTLEYDDVMNAQREEIYDFRSEVLKTENPRILLMDSIQNCVSSHVAEIQKDSSSKDEFIAWLNSCFPLGLTINEIPFDQSTDDIEEYIMKKIQDAYLIKAKHEDEASLKRLEKHLILQSIDKHWQEYLRNMDSLRESIGLQAYGQRDPLVEYKREAYNLFMDLMQKIYDEIASSLFRSATSLQAMEEFFKSLSDVKRPTLQSAVNEVPAGININSPSTGQNKQIPNSGPNRKARRNKKFKRR